MAWLSPRAAQFGAVEAFVMCGEAVEEMGGAERQHFVDPAVFQDFIGNFALKIMVDSAAAANPSNHINALLLASVKVNLGFWRLVSANAYRRRMPTIKPKRIRNFAFNMGSQNSFVNCHIHEPTVSLKG